MTPDTPETPETPCTAQEMRAAIEAVLAERVNAATASAYDWKVSVSALGAARVAFEQVEIDGTARDYGRAVVDALRRLSERHDDPDGVYTSGKADIGSLIDDINSVLARMTP